MATVVPVTTFPFETSLDVAVTTWTPLASNDDGEPLTLTSAALKQIVELPIFIKPRIFGGDGTTSLSVILAGRRSF